MGKECMARLSRRLWGGASLKTAAKEANSSEEGSSLSAKTAARTAEGLAAVKDS